MYCLSTTKKILATTALIASFTAAAMHQEFDTQAHNDEIQAALLQELSGAPIPETVALDAENTALAQDTALDLSNESPDVAAFTSSQDITAISGLTTQLCPTAFYQVKLPNDGKLCQVFAAELPASMIFFVPQSPTDVIEFYQQDSSTYSISRQVKDRFMMQSSDKNTTLIISSDGQGTQVDVLVKSSNS